MEIKKRELEIANEIKRDQRHRHYSIFFTFFFLLFFEQDSTQVAGRE
jgi:hypothetical protein